MLKTASRSFSRTQSRWHNHPVEPSNSHFFPFPRLLKFCLLDSCPSRIDFWIQDCWTKQANWRPKGSHLFYKYSVGGIYSRWPKACSFSTSVMFEHRCCSKDVEPSNSLFFKKMAKNDRNSARTLNKICQKQAFTTCLLCKNDRWHNSWLRHVLQKTLFFDPVFYQE